MRGKQGGTRTASSSNNPNRGTVGDRIFETLVFVNFLAQDASIARTRMPLKKKKIIIPPQKSIPFDVIKRVK